ncbi:N-acetylmuramoyl-L-alanine amidase [Cytobacillus oceanisediminis]|uniref:LysM peptidoglycan-binding domain-containing protein n=1 Tax=Niallia alba TaxID=2729105 RepID=A0A7Y0K8N1_9BACI|nr:MULTISPECIES: N-acetylmuramoyl-L-alanine amidase [Bacillaceae]MBQ6449271.1 N-acetylmuramoyl-L-alanine amidase [Bacillus sp. (in: firmicutes)]MBZ9535846.1 N-acetylmuramoyl-L-alanine amidase [Cytobacillus oceanisediminis]NMO77662.1 LysM peptidoglycan-binding domain-containing protein [Niallia alba]
MAKIFIDAGHGGTDPGAVGNGLQEKVLTLTIAKKIESLLKNYENVSVKMSRTSDTTLSLSQRTDAANAWGSDFFLSVHINAGGGTGYEDYRYNTLTATSATGKVQSTIHSAVMAELKAFNVIDRGAKSANFHVLRETNSPALLSENLFIDTKVDANLLKRNDVLDAIARGHVEGLAKALGLKKKVIEVGKAQSGSYTVAQGDTLWSIAQTQGVTVDQLKTWNAGINPNALQIGSKLNIGVTIQIYNIQKGDIFWDIEEKFNIKHGTLEKLNPSVNVNTLQVGQTIPIR